MAYTCGGGYVFLTLSGERVSLIVEDLIARVSGKLTSFTRQISANVHVSEAYYNRILGGDKLGA